MDDDPRVTDFYQATRAARAPLRDLDEIAHALDVLGMEQPALRLFKAANALEATIERLRQIDSDRASGELQRARAGVAETLSAILSMPERA